MKLKAFLPESSTAIQVIVVLFCAQWFLFQRDSDLPGPITDLEPKISEATAMYLVDQTAPDLDEQIGRLHLNDFQLEANIENLLENGDFKHARTRLLELAAAAVEQNDEKQLGDILLLLGSAAIDEQEINAAEALLYEALDIAIRRGDTMGMGRSYQQLGRLNIKTRALARYASEAYDKLWQARNQIFLGQYRDAESNLQQVIDSNLDIRRYGAAAGALETLADFHFRFHDDYQAQQAGMEAARLYASTGQLSRSSRVIENLKRRGLDQQQLQTLNGEIGELFQQHQKDADQTARARDLQMLYHHHLSQGDSRQAWQLRIQASQTLANTSDRSMFQRQAEVMAILYSSNFAMDRAKRYLDQAGNLFSGSGAEEIAAETADMQSLIY